MAKPTWTDRILAATSLAMVAATIAIAVWTNGLREETRELAKVTRELAHPPRPDITINCSGSWGADEITHLADHPSTVRPPHSTIGLAQPKSLNRLVIKNAGEAVATGLLLKGRASLAEGSAAIEAVQLASDWSVNAGLKVTHFRRL